MKNQENKIIKAALEIIKNNDRGGYDLYRNIQYKDGYCNITDGRILLRSSLIYEESHDGKIINPKTLRVFKELGKFPDVEKLLNSFTEHQYIPESIRIPEFIFKLCSFRIYDHDIIYLNRDGFSISYNGDTIAGIDMRYLSMLKYLNPMIPRIKVKNESTAIIFEYGEPVHTSVIIMPVKI